MEKMIRRGVGKHILLVEDEQDVRILMHNVLLAAGYHVDSVGTMGAGLACVEARRYDLILTDDRLPDGRGIRIADRAGKLGMDAIVITGYGASITKDEVERHDVLLKPVRPDELIEAVDRHVGEG